MPERRHPAETTAARLLDHFECWHDRLTGRERDAISHVRAVLHHIADEDQAAPPTTHRPDQGGNQTTETTK